MAAPSPEQLRRLIVRATIPLLGRSDTLTTAQIARAAGIEESDLVAVYPDKEAVLQACVAALAAHMAAAMEPTDEVRRMDAIRRDQPLASRLVEVLGIVDAYHRRVRADLSAVEQTVIPATTTPGASGTGSSAGQDLRSLSDLPEIRHAVTSLLEPDEHRLRLPAAALAEAFLTMSRVAARTPNEERSPLPAEQVVDLFLHGALTTG